MTTFDIVTALTASELFGAELPLPSQPDWEKVLECAHDQGVVAICYERLNALIESKGIEVDYSNSKHSVFFYEGEEVELHDPVPHTSYNRNDYLTECLVADS